MPECVLKNKSVKILMNQKTFFTVLFVLLRTPIWIQIIMSLPTKFYDVTMQMKSHRQYYMVLDHLSYNISQNKVLEFSRIFLRDIVVRG